MLILVYQADMLSIPFNLDCHLKIKSIKQSFDILGLTNRYSLNIDILNMSILKT